MVDVLEIAMLIGCAAPWRSFGACAGRFTQRDMVSAQKLGWRLFELREGKLRPIVPRMNGKDLPRQ